MAKYRNAFQMLDFSRSLGTLVYEDYFETTETMGGAVRDQKLTCCDGRGVVIFSSGGLQNSDKGFC